MTEPSPKRPGDSRNQPQRQDPALPEPELPDWYSPRWYLKRMTEWERRQKQEEWGRYEQELERYQWEQRARERRERYTADPIAYIGNVLAREFGSVSTAYGDYNVRERERRLSRLYRRSDDFILGYYLRALKHYDKLGDRKGAAQFVADVQRAILKQLPDSAFRRHLQKQVKSWAGIGLRGKRS